MATVVTLRSVIEAAMKNVTFMDSLIADPSKALAQEGWTVSKDEMTVLQELVGRAPLGALAKAFHAVFSNLKEQPIANESLMGQPWAKPQT